MGIWSTFSSPVGDGEEKSSLLSTFFHTATYWYPRGRLHCNPPHFCGCSVCYCFLPTSPHGISFYLLSAPPCMLLLSLSLLLSPHHPVPLSVCITFKTLMFTFKSVCAALLNLNSQLLYSSHFLLVFWPFSTDPATVRAYTLLVCTQQCSPLSV